jgi:acyl-CoA synthetase (AMP-forming)/AMP-acid ligase II
MSVAKSRLSSILGHFTLPSGSPSSKLELPVNRHGLSPTIFLPRAASIEPEVQAIYHVTANQKVLRRSYIEFADRARGLAYYLKKHGYKRTGVLCPNTPGFLESIFGIAAAGGTNIGMINYLAVGNHAHQSPSGKPSVKTSRSGLHTCSF